MSLSSLCVQVLLSVWTEAAEVMPAVVAGRLAREEKSRGVFVFSLCSSLLLSVWTEAAEVMSAVVAGWLDGLQEEKSRGVSVFSLCSSAALCVERGSRGHASCCCWMACRRGRAEVSLSSLCAQVMLSVWSEAAEAMPAVVAGWLAREEKSRGVFVFSLCSRAALCVE